MFDVQDAIAEVADAIHKGKTDHGHMVLLDEVRRHIRRLEDATAPETTLYETRTLHVELEELLEAARKNGRFPMEPTITQLFADHQGVDHLLDGEYVFTGSDNTVTVTPLLTFEVTGIWVTDDDED